MLSVVSDLEDKRTVTVCYTCRPQFLICDHFECKCTDLFNKITSKKQIKYLEVNKTNRKIRRLANCSFLCSVADG